MAPGPPGELLVFFWGSSSVFLHFLCFFLCVCVAKIRRIASVLRLMSCRVVDHTCLSSRSSGWFDVRVCETTCSGVTFRAPFRLRQVLISIFFANLAGCGRATGTGTEPPLPIAAVMFRGIINWVIPSQSQSRWRSWRWNQSRSRDGGLRFSIHIPRLQQEACVSDCLQCWFTYIVHWDMQGLQSMRKLVSGPMGSVGHMDSPPWLTRCVF